MERYACRNEDVEVEVDADDIFSRQLQCGALAGGGPMGKQGCARMVN